MGTKQANGSGNNGVRAQNTEHRAPSFVAVALLVVGAVAGASVGCWCQCWVVTKAHEAAVASQHKIE